MKQVYILLSRTETLPSRVIHSATGGSFTHASIALTPETDRFYSYARRKLHNALNAGLLVENVHKFVFALYPDCHCRLYAVEVSDQSYQKIQSHLAHFMNHYKKAKYNFAGIVPLRMGIRWRRKFRLTCSQFVALMLSNAKEIQLPKDPYLMLPNDFLKIKNMKLIYDGTLSNCSFGAVKKETTL